MHHMMNAFPIFRLVSKTSLLAAIATVNAIAPIIPAVTQPMKQPGIFFLMFFSFASQLKFLRARISTLKAATISASVGTVESGNADSRTSK